MDGKEAARIREAITFALWLNAGGDHEHVNSDSFTCPHIRKVVTDATAGRTDLVRQDIDLWLDALDVIRAKGEPAVEAIVERTNDHAELQRRTKAAHLRGVMAEPGATERQRLTTLRELGIGDAND